MALGARPFYLVLTVFLFSQVITSLWPRHYLRHQQHPSNSLSSWMSKRSLDGPDAQCQDVLAHPDKCAFVEAYCSDYPAGLINYLHFYFCDLAHLPVAAVLILGTWVVFLFGFVGVAASDFFCPNLSTIAKKLHLSESMTGVTFLAFGNGSPDVFSTFSAMGAGSASLAIGELVGAASFITSVVVGSMAIIKPFKVSKAPFLRDVIFFAGCVLFTLYTVMDGKITMVESVTLIVYYIFYVAFVVVGNWYHQRIKTERELEERARNLYDDDDEDAEPVDFDEEHGLLNNGSGRKQKPFKISTFAVAGPYDAYDDDDEEELDDGYISPSQISSNDFESHQTLVSSMENLDVNMPRHHQLSQNSGGVENSISMRPSGSSVRRRPSLLSAFEFNDVVRSLSLSGSRGRIASYDPSYYGVKSPIHKRHSTRPHSANDASSRAVSVMSTHSQEGASSSSGLVIEHNEIMSTSPMDMDHDADALFDQAMLRQSLILPDHHNPANQHLGHVHPHGINAKDNPWTWKRLAEFLKAIQPIYFPTLLDWDDKTPFIKFLAMTSIPMVFLLTLTLPVVEIKEKEEDDESTDSSDVTRRSPKIVVDDADKHKGDQYEGWSRTATTVQMLVAPVFVAAVISSAAEYGVVPILIALFVGSILSAAIYYSSTEEEPPRFYGALCFAGFLVAITWIFLVANEVVGVLQAFGMIFGVSDAILGLTIFAMGNSLGDLVANITIAKMGFPRMAFSACFGGPLLSISGTYMTLKTGTAIPLEVSPTLFVSLIGVLMTLLAALMIVPRNGYMMGRWWGWFLLIVYLICTVVNVVVEITMSKED